MRQSRQSTCQFTISMGRQGAGPSGETAGVQQISTTCLQQHHDNAVPILVDNATANGMVKLKCEITNKNVLTKSMQAKLGSVLQDVEESNEGLPTTGDGVDMIRERM